MELKTEGKAIYGRLDSTDDPKVKGSLRDGGRTRYARSEFMASISEACMVAARSAESFVGTTSSTGSTITESAASRARDKVSKFDSIIDSHAGSPPESEYRRYHSPEPRMSSAGRC